jgi:ubiquinone/menaquinone biosynthesis C-methylase UbiE
VTAPSSEDVQQFHRWSRTYERSLGQLFFFGPAHRAVLRLAGESLGRPPEVVLDIGCGTGRLLRRAAARWPGAAFVGVDPAQGMIDIARQLTPAAEFLAGQGEHLPLVDGSVEAAFSTISFHHWQDQAAGVREVARVLRRGGTFCLADINLPLFTGRLIPHARVHTRAEMAALFSQAGLAVRSQKPILGGAVLVTGGTKG